MSKRRGKYGAKKVLIDGYLFHSKKEAKRYAELRLLERAGEISDLELQPKFLLQPKFKDAQGRSVRALTYTADFRYNEIETGLTVTEDVKGVKTQAFSIKWKLLKYQSRNNTGLDFRIVE